MAEALFNTLVAKDPLLSGKFISSSAGIMAIDGEPASNNSVQALKEDWGIDISLHRTKQLKVEDIEDAYLVLTMTRSHKEAIISLFPEAKYKTFTLKEYANGEASNNYNYTFDYTLDIPDPYSMSLHVYKQCASDIKIAIDNLIARLKQEI